MDSEQLMFVEAAELQEEYHKEKQHAFVDKFKPKLTTDDCYTPEPVYQAIADWVAHEYGRDKSTFVRPFWPGGDYMAEEYQEGCVVVDNPPFSILSQILKFYHVRGIDFFLFAPSLTLYSGGFSWACYISSDSDITYANGAVVRTGFITSMDKYQIRSAPTLYKTINEANDAVQKATKRELPKYTYPDYICTSAMVQRYSHYGIDFAISADECRFVRAMDAQREQDKAIFGGGFLLSERAAAERAAAERAAAERAAAERAAATRWHISDREWAIIKSLGKKEE